jgi:hypothetical protein
VLEFYTGYTDSPPAISNKRLRLRRNVGSSDGAEAIASVIRWGKYHDNKAGAISD